MKLSKRDVAMLPDDTWLRVVQETAEQLSDLLTDGETRTIPVPDYIRLHGDTMLVVLGHLISRVASASVWLRYNAQDKG